MIHDINKYMLKCEYGQMFMQIPRLSNAIFSPTVEIIVYSYPDINLMHKEYHEFIHQLHKADMFPEHDLQIFYSEREIVNEVLNKIQSLLAGVAL